LLQRYWLLHLQMKSSIDNLTVYSMHLLIMHWLLMSRVLLQNYVC